MRSLEFSPIIIAVVGQEIYRWEYCYCIKTFDVHLLARSTPWPVWHWPIKSEIGWNLILHSWWLRLRQSDRTGSLTTNSTWVLWSFRMGSHRKFISICIFTLLVYVSWILCLEKNNVNTSPSSAARVVTWLALLKIKHLVMDTRSALSSGVQIMKSYLLSCQRPKLEIPGGLRN